jgi:hypothetical protein
MMLLGCRPKDRLIEQHDMFFGVGTSLGALIPQIKKSWPQGKSNLHVDAWREVTIVDGYRLSVCKGVSEKLQKLNLYFINLGGYQKSNFDELHYKILIVAPTAAMAVKKAKTYDFYKSAGFKGAESHIDNKYEVDDIINVKDILTGEFYLNIEKIKVKQETEDEIHLGYFKLNTLKD